MRRFARPSAVVLIVGASMTAAVAADDLVPPGAELELLYTRTAPIRGGLTEGVAAARTARCTFRRSPSAKTRG